MHPMMGSFTAGLQHASNCKHCTGRARPRTSLFACRTGQERIWARHQSLLLRQLQQLLQQALCLLQWGSAEARVRSALICWCCQPTPPLGSSLPSVNATFPVSG